jgi:carnitine-CoA ligase
VPHSRLERLDVAPRERTLPRLLLRRAEVSGDAPFVGMPGRSSTFADACDIAARTAALLADAGVGCGDRVAVVSENQARVVDLFFGCFWLGATFVPVNTASRGSQLERILVNASPRLLVLDSRYLSRIAALPVRPAELERVWLLDGDPGKGRIALPGVPSSPMPPPGGGIAPADVTPEDTAAILYTSGTTGPSKGVCCPHAQFYWWGINTGAALEIVAGDVLYNCLPLFHTNALNTLAQGLVAGAEVTIGERFSASRFWQRILDADATVTYLLGAMVSILAKGTPTPLDRAHRLRVALAPATPKELVEPFEARFGVRLVEGHGMTETNFVIGPRDGRRRIGTMGRVMPGFEARVVDENDADLPPDQPGELVLRADEALSFADGYWGLPNETRRAWRNGWFHTGDRVVCDREGYFRFLDRLKDVIRRRGENISAWEVEEAALSHPDVQAAAVVPVPSELGEDEVMLCVVPRPGAELDPETLLRFCEPRLPYFALPRFVDVLNELPLSESGKVQKYLLRDRGIGAATWDREAAGYVVSRD